MQRDWTDLVKPKVPTLPKGDGFTYQAIWTWIAYPDVQPEVERRTEEGDVEYEPAAWWTPNFKGFRALVLSNPLGGQTRRESEAWRAYNRGELSEPEYLESIADRVKAWDYRIISDDGERIDVPAPAADSWQRFYDLPAALMAWLVQEVRTVHFPKRPTRAGANAGTTDSTAPSERAPETEHPTS